MPNPTRRCGGRASKSTSPSLTLPVAGIAPIKARSKVVLPAPLRPIRPHISPSARSSDALRMTGTGPIETSRSETLSMKPANAIRAIQITTRFPAVHGAPVHIGKPELIGIADLGRPDYGDAVPIHDDEIPVFWACGVTPQSVVATVKPEFCITHYPGSMSRTISATGSFGRGAMTCEEALTMVPVER